MKDKLKGIFWILLLVLLLGAKPKMYPSVRSDLVQSYAYYHRKAESSVQFKNYLWFKHLAKAYRDSIALDFATTNFPLPERKITKKK